MKKRLLSLFLAISMIVSLWNGVTITAFAANSITYIDENGESQTCDSYGTYTYGSEWGSGWKYHNSGAFIGTSTIASDLHIIIQSGRELQASSGSGVTISGTLSLYGTTTTGGKFTAINGTQTVNGTLNVYSGSVKLTNLAGSGTVNIYGGEVTVTNTINVANLNIYGGTLIVTGNSGKAAVSSSTNVTINGKVVMKAGASSASNDITGNYASAMQENRYVTMTVTKAPPHTHEKDTYYAEVPATCSAEGTVAYWSCSGCDQMLDEDGKVIPDTETAIAIDRNAHEWELLQSDSAGCSYVCAYDASHTDSEEHNGASCTRCGWVPHDHVVGTKHDAVAPTCVSAGIEEYYDCRVEGCNEKLNAAGTVISDPIIPVDANAHDWGEWTANGDKRKRTCQNDPAHLEEGVAYIGDNGQMQVCASYGTYQNMGSGWGSGWRFANYSRYTSISESSISSDLHVIIKNGCELQASYSNGLTIHNTGKLSVYGTCETGGTFAPSGNTITVNGELNIYSGNVTLKGISGTGTVNIYGGKVTATNTISVANLNIYGGTVTVTASSKAITSPNVTIDGKVTEMTSGAAASSATAVSGDYIDSLAKPYVHLEVQRVPPHDHEGVKVVGQAATCTEDGWQDYYACSVCGKLFTDENCTSVITDLKTWQAGDGKILGSGEHSFGEWIAEVPATETTDGVKGYQHCAVCGAYYDADQQKLTDLTIPSLGVEIPAASNTTWTYNGQTQTYDVPAREGYYTILGNMEKDAGGHIVIYTLVDPAYHWSDGTTRQKTITWSIRKAVYDGEKTAVCEIDTINGKTAEVILPSLPDGASYGAVSNSNSALDVGTINAGQLTITSKGISSTGTLELSVAVDGGTNYENYNIVVTISPIVHTHAADVAHYHEAVDGTCTATGMVAYYDCTVEGCTEKLSAAGTVISDPIIPVDANAHDWGEWTVTGDTYKRTCRNNSSHTQTGVAYMDENGQKTVYIGMPTSVSQGSGWDSSWYFVNSTVSIYSRRNIKKDSYMILKDGCSLDVQGGLTVDNGYTLNLYCQDAGTGRLLATGGNAIIVNGTLNVYGGHINLSKSNISGTGTVNIYGGTVSVSSATSNTPAISVAKLNIYGGTVTATGSSQAITSTNVTIDGKVAEMTAGAAASSATAVSGDYIDSLTKPYVHLEVQRILPHDHEGVKVVGQAATCTEGGWQDYYTCSICGKLFTDEACTSAITNLKTWQAGDGKTQPKGHSFDTWINEVPATEITDGVMGYQHCSVCGKDFDAGVKELTDKTISALGVEIPAASNTTWTYNGQTQTYDVPAREGYYTILGNTAKDAGGHIIIYTLADPTYHWSDGTTDPKTINWSIRKAVYDGEKTAACEIDTRNGRSAEVTLPSLPDGASYGAVSNSNSALEVGTISVGKLTITSKGISSTDVLTISVAVDGGTNYEEYNILITITPIVHVHAIDHDHYHEAVDATCETDGSVAYYGCLDCDTNLNENAETIANVVITKLGHAYAAEFTVDIPATCTEPGSQSKHCVRCSAVTEVTEIAALGHSFAEAWSMDSETHWHAAICDHTTEKKDFAQHAYSDYVCETCKREDVASAQKDARDLMDNACVGASNAVKALAAQCKTEIDRAASVAAVLEAKENGIKEINKQKLQESCNGDITVGENEVKDISAELSNDLSAAVEGLSGAVEITPDEKAQGVYVWVTTDQVEASHISTEELASIADAKKDSMTIASYLNINVFKQTASGEKTQIGETSQEITISIVVPEEYRADNRTFYILTTHEGTSRIIEASSYDPTTGVLTFKSAQFSVYALGYADETVYEVDSEEEFRNAVTTINALPSGYYTIVLRNDITVEHGTSSGLPFNGNHYFSIITDGNPRTLTLKSEYSLFVNDGATLDLGKKQGTDPLTIAGTINNDKPGLLFVGTGGVLNMYDGVTLKDHTGSNYFGGGVTVKGGLFNMYGGTIENCGITGTICHGGGVAVAFGGKFVMNGGTIQNCFANSTYISVTDPTRCIYGVGGGVFVAGGSEFIMNGGTIQNNEATNMGGGVALFNTRKEIEAAGNQFGYIKSRFEMNSGTICGNKAKNGAGVVATGYFYAAAEALCAPNPGIGTTDHPGLFINGGTITQNVADSQTGMGGGLLIAMLRPSLGAEVHDAVIKGNTAAKGAGVEIYGYWTQTDLDGCEITGNQALKGEGGGIAVENNTAGGKTAIKNSTICNNAASVEAADVYMRDCSVGLCAADTSATYLGLPVEMTGKKVDGWYKDTREARYATQGAVDRVSQNTDTFELSGGAKVCLIAAVNAYRVTFDVKGHGTAPEAQMIPYGGLVESPNLPDVSGYRFTGWYKDENCTEAYVNIPVTNDMTLYAGWRRVGGGSTPSTTDNTLTYESNGGTKYPTETYPNGTVVELNKLPAKDGYVFNGWYSDPELTHKIDKVTVNGNVKVYAGWTATKVPAILNGDDHYAYIIGFKDGNVKPYNLITRAQATTIFFRLLKPEVRDGNLVTSNTYSDVPDNYWANTAISTMTALGLINGYSDGTFRPNASITRAQFAAICARFDTSLVDGYSNFTDISNHWAKAEIERTATLGWIQGFKDGTFRPDEKITRAQAATMINRVLDRIPETEEDLLAYMVTWPDNTPADWCYIAMQEATNSHDHIRKGEVYETWTELTQVPDWKRYEN